MNLFFKNPEFDLQLKRTLGYTYYQGADIGECLATASRIKEDDFESWYEEWKKTADRIAEIGDECAQNDRKVSAKEAYLRACQYYRTAEFFLRTNLFDPRILEISKTIQNCFRKAANLSPFPIEVVEIPYENTVLWGYFYKVDESGIERPTVIMPGGGDSFVEECHHQGALAAIQRGYNCLIFDGPGQGHVLRQQKLFFRSDWNKVITPVVDFLLTKKEVKKDAIILLGRSFGGLLNAIAAVYEKRLAALILDPGQISGKLAFKKLLSPELLELYNKEDREKFNAIFENMFKQNKFFEFKIKTRMYPQNASNPYDYFKALEKFSIEGKEDQIVCPTLICYAENEHLSTGQAKLLFDKLTCTKEFILFTDEEGAGDHVEFLAPSLFCQKVFDWLDSIFDPMKNKLEYKKI